MEPLLTDDVRIDETGGAFACPLCGLADETRSDVYRHLQISHRKSAIASALLDASDPGAGRGERP